MSFFSWILASARDLMPFLSPSIVFSASFLSIIGTCLNFCSLAGFSSFFEAFSSFLESFLSFFDDFLDGFLSFFDSFFESFFEDFFEAFLLFF